MYIKEASQKEAAHYTVEYVENDVTIDPILNKAVHVAAKRVENWIDEDMIQKKKPRRRAIYLHEDVVRKSLHKLAHKIRNETFSTNKENPDAQT